MEDLKFRAEVDARPQGDQLYFGYLDTDQFDIDFEKCKATVEYSLQVNTRSWGIDSIHVYISKITCTVEWYAGAEELEQEQIDKLLSYGGVEQRNGNIEGSFKIDTTKQFKGKSWEIVMPDLEFKKDGGFQIDEIEINLPEASIEIK